MQWPGTNSSTVYAASGCLVPKFPSSASSARSVPFSCKHRLAMRRCRPTQRALKSALGAALAAANHST